MTTPSVIFRADASREMGTGHVMRCLTLADALAARGWQCGFVCRDQEGNLADWIRSRGHSLWLLPAGKPGEPVTANDSSPPHARWLGVPWQQDARETAVIVGKVGCLWLVVDHYGIHAPWERTLARQTTHLMVIDDLADRDHECALLLDQNPGRTPASYSDRVPESCTCLTGTDYALLRDEFREWRDRYPPASRRPGVRRILVTLGGADPDNVTGRVLSALAECQLPSETVVDVIMGPSSPWLDRVRTQARQMPYKATVTVGATDMAERMALADLAVGAAGATTWERCYLGLPSLVVAIAQNQHEFLAQMASGGLAAVADLPSLEQDVTAFIHGMQSHPERYLAMARRSSLAVDGNGASRVADCMTAMLEPAA